VILGIDLEADSTRVASTEARALVAGLGRDRVEALELGNEPELYGIFIWDGSGHTGRPHAYDFAGYSNDVSRMMAPLPHVPLAGPATGAPKWFPDLGKFLAAHRDVAAVTLHRYPLQLCFVSPGSPITPRSETSCRRRPRAGRRTASLPTSGSPTATESHCGSTR
jgi:hypothetical protein